MSETWYPQAVKIPGPGWKQGYNFATLNLRQGAIYHSMAGSYVAAYRRLIGPDSVSWHFSVLQNGTVIQHYPLEAVTWHAGSIRANSTCVGIEHEGGAAPNYSEPLTDAQYTAMLRLTLWLLETLRWPEFRVGVQGLEHNWVYPTACPSGRIPWDRLVADVSKEGTMDQELRDRVRAAAAFRAVAAAIEQGQPIQTLPTDTLNAVRYILRVAGVI